MLVVWYKEDAYRIVQRNAHNAFENEQGDGNFKLNLEKDADVTSHMTKVEIENCFNTEDYLKNLDKIYSRFGLE